MANVPCLRAGLCLASGLFALLGAAPTAHGDEPRVAVAAIGAAFQDPVGAVARADNGATAALPQREYLGLSAGGCFRCHNTGVQGQAVLGPGGVPIQLEDDHWVLYSEYPIWQRDDKHGQAYTVLLNERSKKMGEILGIEAVHRDKRCLACHTGYPINQMPLGPDGLVTDDVTTRQEVNFGVSCEGCHGPAGDRTTAEGVALKGWKDPHQLQPVKPYDQTSPWRFMTPEQKESTYGYWDVRTPDAKARICASCHIGNVRQGKVVTHEMYAAGHPPLPGFELETFVHQMPNHWVELARKGDKVRTEFLANTKDPLYADREWEQDDLHRTKSALVAGLVSLSEYLKLTAHLADDQIASPVPKTEWPELAQFDCFACHHELKTPAWRQERAPLVGVPGRPPFREWTTTVAELAVGTAGLSREDFQKKLNPVRRALAEQPFGVRSELTSAALEAAGWLDAAARELQTRALTPEEGRRLLDQIAAKATSEILDYDAARQLVWTFAVVYRELYPDPQTLQENYRPTGVPGWFDKEENLDPVEKQLVKLEEMFLLDLREGRGAETQLPGEQQARATVEVDLHKVLPYVEKYEPGKFQESFAEMTRAVDQRRAAAGRPAP